jgi:hypothetical protein
MNNSFAATDTQALVLRSEYASVPLRSPASSIILAEAVRRSERAPESRNISHVAAAIIRSLFSPFAIGGLDAEISTVLTPGGPLVYRW